MVLDDFVCDEACCENVLGEEEWPCRVNEAVDGGEWGEWVGEPDVDRYVHAYEEIGVS